MFALDIWGMAKAKGSFNKLHVSADEIAFLRPFLSAPNGLMRAPDTLRDGAHSNQRPWNACFFDAVTDLYEATRKHHPSMTFAWQHVVSATIDPISERPAAFRILMYRGPLSSLIFRCRLHPREIGR